MFGKEKHQKAPEDVPGIAGEPSYLKPKAGIAVTDANPTVTSVVAFERKALKNSAFKFTASEATILNVKSFKGYTAQVGRVDGRFAYDALYSFASGDTKLSVAAKEARDGRVLTAKYTHFVKKPNNGIVEATVKSGNNKLNATHALAKNISAVTWTREQLHPAEEGLLPATITTSAGVTSQKAVKLGWKKKVGPDTYSLDYIFPFVASATWKHKQATISATAPITKSGLGETRLMVSFEPVFKL